MPILADVTSACGNEDVSRVCVQVYRWTGNEAVAGLSEWAIERPVRILFIFFVAWLIAKFLRRAVAAVGDRIRTSPSHPRLRALREGGPGSERMNLNETARAPARAEAIESVLKSVVTIGVWVTAVFVAAGEFDVNLAPLVAGAGVIGIAIGFGAQSIVADFLAGMFMLIEDQYGIGDVIEVNGAVGEVENMNLRTTKLRDLNGTVWHIPNGEIKRVGNHSQIWSNALVDVSVSYDTDLRHAMQVMGETSKDLLHELAMDDDFGDIIDDPVVMGVQRLDDSGVVLRLLAKTDPAAQWKIERELRLRIKEAFDAHGIEIPYPQRQMHIRGIDAFMAPPSPQADGTEDR